MQVLEAIKKLKDGIVNNDEELIEEGFFLLTGEKIRFPEFEDDSEFQELKKDYNKKVIKNTSSMVRALEDPDFTMNRKPEKKEGKRPNLFVPDIELDEEEGWDKIDDQVAPVPRTRAGYADVDVLCQDCNKTISVNPQFAKNPYRCDFIKLGQPCPHNKGSK